MNLKIVVFGLSMSSSWGNGHATTYRSLLKALARRGHAITFLERDVPWYRDHRDLDAPGYCDLEFYAGLQEVPRRFGELVRNADLVILGSYVPDGIVLADWITSHARGVTAFYDIDTPVTLSRLATGDADYIAADLIPRFDLYLSFTGGAAPERMEQLYGSPRARVLYCSADPEFHVPVRVTRRWLLGYLGTYSADRQPALQKLLLDPAAELLQRPFVIAGASYPAGEAWPANVEHIPHLAPQDHAAFYCAQRFTLNVTRADMATLGYSPSVRLFEAAACGVPVISDAWPGLDTLFAPGREIVIARDGRDVTAALCEMPEERRMAMAAQARQRLLRDHTADHRARELEDYYQEVLDERRGAGAPRVQMVEI